MRTKGGKQRASWFITLPVAAGAMAYLAFLFFPGTRVIGTLRDELRLKQDVVSQTEQLRPVIRSLQQELAQTREYIQASRTRTPGDAELAAVLGGISEQCQLAGVTTTRLEPQAAIELSMLKQVPVSLGVKGSYAEIYQFLTNLERLPFSIWMRELCWEAPREAGQPAECELKLAIFAGRPRESD